MTVTLHEGDCLEVMARLIDEGVRVDSCVTDPPYHLTSIVKRFGSTSIDRDGTNERRAAAGADGMARLSRGFMGKQWDGGDIAFRPETWRLVFELMKPGAYLVAFSGTRTYHRMACAIEDAGFVVRDQFAWVYGSGFPKSHDISKAIDKAAGAKRKVVGKRPEHVVSKKWREAEGRDDLPTSILNITEAATAEARKWNGWGTAVKPAWEPICLAQKPVEGTIAGNVLKHGVGGLNIDGCRIDNPDFDPTAIQRQSSNRQTWKGGENSGFAADHVQATYDHRGRFPANIVHDGSDEVLACFPYTASGTGAIKRQSGSDRDGNSSSALGKESRPAGTPMVSIGDSGSAARFFYTAKADETDRWGSKHPTVKPVDLIRYFARLVTPPGGLMLDLFAGSGTAGVAAIAEGFDAILIEREAEYAADIRERIAFYSGEGRHSIASKNRHASAPKPGENPLIDWIDSQEEAAE